MVEHVTLTLVGTVRRSGRRQMYIFINFVALELYGVIDTIIMLVVVLY